MSLFHDVVTAIIVTTVIVIIMIFSFSFTGEVGMITSD